MKGKILFVISILILSMIVLTGCLIESEAKLNENQIEWEVRKEYVKDGEVLFSIFPDPALVAGKSFGYIFHFTEPFEVFKGKELGIYAYHQETGEKITVVSPKTITEPSPGYSSLERFTANFELPVGGFWRYEVVLDDVIYGDVVLSVEESKGRDN